MISDLFAQKAASALVLVMTIAGQPAFADTTSANTTDVASLEIVAEPSVQDVLLAVCEKNGYGENCAETLTGMLWIESNNRFDVVGDHGLALGYFQIHYKMHKISADCAKDLVCSANWTIGYMERHSYPTYVSYAVQCHNSCNAGNGYAAKALRNGARLWDQPLTITQDAAIDLSQIPDETVTAIALN
ncbi:hypothetical protein EBS80_02070 [bacterium]|nr:hypothetical protein [bacterium]